MQWFIYGSIATLIAILTFNNYKLSGEIEEITKSNTTLYLQLKTLSENITTQNAAIDGYAKQTKLQYNNLVEASGKNVIIREHTNKEVVKILTEEVPKDCDTVNPWGFNKATYILQEYNND